MKDRTQKDSEKKIKQSVYISVYTSFNMYAVAIKHSKIHISHTLYRKVWLNKKEKKLNASPIQNNDSRKILDRTTAVRPAECVEQRNSIKSKDIPSIRPQCCISSIIITHKKKQDEEKASHTQNEIITAARTENEREREEKSEQRHYSLVCAHNAAALKSKAIEKGAPPLGFEREHSLDRSRAHCTRKR